MSDNQQWTCKGPYEQHTTTEKPHTHSFCDKNEDGVWTEYGPEMQCDACFVCCPI